MRRMVSGCQRVRSDPFKLWYLSPLSREQASPAPCRAHQLSMLLHEWSGHKKIAVCWRASERDEPSIRSRLQGWSWRGFLSTIRDMEAKQTRYERRKALRAALQHAMDVLRVN